MTLEKISPENVIGEKLKDARQDREMSLRDLAKLAEISASMLSQIETGKASPSVGSLYKIAAALDVPMDYFFPSQKSLSGENQEGEGISTRELTPSEMREVLIGESVESTEDTFKKPLDSNSPVVEIDGRPMIELKSGITWSRLTSQAENDIEFLEIAYAPGAASGKAMSRHSGREFGLVLSGLLVVELGFETYHLKVGDSIIFESMTPHRLSNPSDEWLRAIWVVYGTSL